MLITSGRSGIEMSLRTIAKLAKRDSERPAMQQSARELTDPYPTVQRKVRAIVGMLNESARPTRPTPELPEEVGMGGRDADDMVIAAATACLAVGIPCRFVGARYGQSWTCWLAYQDGEQWITIDVIEGASVGNLRKPDEQVTVGSDGALVGR